MKANKQVCYSFDHTIALQQLLLLCIPHCNNQLRNEPSERLKNFNEDNFTGTATINIPICFILDMMLLHRS
ncbi:hypothetical protein NPIL_359661 [Nephila pilipes]|uniref:Uncharacterized protein n=1 Tax=Nephila pilipes TaxID=299642 RepID=A0A8X6NX82_NEPPI|nr:hypothetical protein NPIL_359661 [Nephila pilipes]